MPLHFQVALGRKIVLVDRMDLHLLWGADGKIFIKAMPTFLLSPDFWRNWLGCHDNHGYDSSVSNEATSNSTKVPAAALGVALGFLYTYACLICSETDFRIANDQHLLPRRSDNSTIKWPVWKELTREVLGNHEADLVHPRFQRAELRLSRVNIIHRVTRRSPFDSDVSSWNNYSSLFRDNLAWMTAATVFVALVLTAMSVGLATDRLKGNNDFQRASSGFAVFAILGLMCAFALVVLTALANLAKDFPGLLKDMLGQSKTLVQSPSQREGARTAEIGSGLEA
ncbi:hypothetical protein CDD83_3469 [Cordyceps sp. RAO-2017]|nr:hypothetical protein CDD83_3469 [Cordyceps sp. RAO-2017]